MKVDRRYLLQGCSVALFTLVNTIGISAVQLGDASPVLVIGGICAVAAAAHAMVWEAEALTPALLLSLPPLVILAAEERGAWLIGPLAGLLYLASELLLAGWEYRGVEVSGVLARRRAAGATLLAGGAATASVLVIVAASLGPSLEGIAAVVVAAGALTTLGWVLFGRGP